MLLESVSMVLKNSTPTFEPSVAASVAGQARVPLEARKQAAEEKRAEGLSQLAQVAMDREGETAEPRKVNLNFSVHEASGQIVVSVVDKETGDVIREIPPEALLDLAAKLQEAVGLLCDKNA